MTDQYRIFDHFPDIPPGTVVMDALGHVTAVAKGASGGTVPTSVARDRLPLPPFLELLDARSAGHAFGVLQDYINRTEGTKR